MLNRNTSIAPSATLSGILLLGSVLACGVAPPEKKAAQSVWLTPTTYRVASTELSSPVTIVTADYYRDGGSMMVKFRDAGRRELMVVNFTPLIEGGEVDEYKDERDHFYVGGFPRDRGVVRLKPGGKDELELQRLLGDCVRHAEAEGEHLVQPDNPPADYERQWSEYNDRSVRGFQSRLAYAIQKAGTVRSNSSASPPN